MRSRLVRARARLAGAADRDASAVGRERGSAQAGQIYDAVVKKIVVHHTGTPNDITDYAGLCRGIFANETAGEYIDIAYNWLIDPNGRIYEGRWAQDYGLERAHR